MLIPNLNADSPGKRGVSFNRSPGMSEILAPSMRVKGGDSTAKSLGMNSLSQASANVLSPAQAVDRTPIQESSKPKRPQEDMLKLNEPQKQLEERKKESHHAKKPSSPLSPNKTLTDYQPKPKEELEKYRKELKVEMEVKRMVAKAEKEKEKEQEKAVTGLNLESFKGDRFKTYKEQQKEVLKKQMMEEQLRKLESRGKGENSPSNTKLDEDLLARQNLIEEGDKKVKEVVKAGYASSLQEREVKTAVQKQRKVAEQEEALEKQREIRERMMAEKKAELERKKSLGDYLLTQIQGKNGKKTEPEPAKTAEIVEKSVRPATKGDASPEIPKVDPVVAKKENIKMAQMKEQGKVQEKTKEKEMDEEYLKREQQLEEHRRKLETLKKEEQKRNLEESRKNLESKKAQQVHQEKSEDKNALEYFEKMNSETISKIKEEQEKQKEKTKVYSESLLVQLGSYEEAKKKQHESELEKEKALQGMELDSYKRAEMLMNTKEKYKQEISHQYSEALKKTKVEPTVETTKLSLVTPAEEQQRDVKESKEEKTKKVKEHEAYLRALDERSAQRKVVEEQKATELAERIEQGHWIKSSFETAKQKEKEKQKKLANVLESQAEVDKVKKEKQKADRFEWMDERARKHAEAVEERVNKLRDEIQKCIKGDSSKSLPKVKANSP